MRGVTLGAAAFLAWVLQLLSAPASAQTYNFSPGCRLESILTIGSGIFGGTTKDCGEPGVNHVITPDTDGIDNPNHQASVAGEIEEVNPSVRRVVISGRARQVVDGQGTVTTTARFDAGFRPHVSPVNTPSVIRVESDISAKWERGAFGSAGSVSLNAGFECPGFATLGASVAIDSRLSGTASTKRTLKCVLTPNNPFGFLTQINLTGVAAAGSQSGKAEDMSYAGTFTVSVVPAGKELKGVSGPIEAVQGVLFAQPFVVQVFKNDTDAAVAGERVTFQLKTLAGEAVGQVPAVEAETLPDGTALAYFTVQESGDYLVEAACAGCVAGSPVTFPVKILRLTDAALLTVQSMGRTGVAGESRLRNPLVVQVVNKLDGKTIPDISFVVGFEMVPNGSCSSGTHPEASSAVTAGPFSAAKTHVKPGATAGRCRIRAFCEQCLAGPEAFADFEIVDRPELQIDGGEPGNPFSMSGGGPSPTASRRNDENLEIHYKFDTSPQYHRTLSATPESRRDGYVAALTGDTINFRLNPEHSEAAAWTDTLGFSGQGAGVNRVYGAIAADKENPIILAAQTSNGTERIRILIEERPATLSALTGEHGEYAAYVNGLMPECAVHFPLWNCLLLIRARYDANNWASKTFSNRGTNPSQSCGNGCCNAAKHAYWSALMANLADGTLARRIGLEHEGTGLFDGNSHNSIVMDLQNNFLGQFLGTDVPKSSLQERVRTAIENGQALIFEEDPDSLSLLVRSNSCAE